MKMRRKSTVVTVEAEVDISEFDDDVLIEELESRGYEVAEVRGFTMKDQAYLAMQGREDIPEPIRELVLMAAGRIA